MFNLLKKTPAHPNRINDDQPRTVQHPEFRDVQEDANGKEERTMVWHAAKGKYVLFKKKNWKRDADGHLIPVRSEYYGTDGVLQTSHSYEQTSEGFFGIASNYAYANGNVVRRTDSKQQFVNGNWVPISNSETQFSYTRAGDVFRSETVTKDPEGKLIESSICSFDYSAPGQLHSSDVVCYDANNLLKSQAHFEHEPTIICTEQKYYIPILDRPGKVVLCMAEFRDSANQEPRSVMYRPSHKGRFVSFDTLDAFEIKDGQVARQFKSDSNGNELGDNAPTKMSINFPSRKGSELF